MISYAVGPPLSGPRCNAYGGADVFAFALGDGAGAIIDFENGLDTIEFSGLTFADLAITQSGADVLISYGAGDTILIENLLLSSVTSDDFNFV